MLMFRNTPRSPTDLSPAQLVFGRHLRDSLPFSRQMLRPQNRYEIEKRRLEVTANRHKENDESKRRKLPLLRPGQRVRFQDPITKKWEHTGKVVGFGETDRDYWVKDDVKARRYRRNRRFIKPIDFEALPPPSQPVQAPPPVARESTRVDQRSFADVPRQPLGPGASQEPLRSALSSPEPRRGERDKKKSVRFGGNEWTK